MKTNQGPLQGDYSFKKWFKIMWSNGYIAYFIFAIVFIVLEFNTKDEILEAILESSQISIILSIAEIFAFFIPWIWVIIIIKLGFIDLWKKLVELDKESKR